MKAFFLWAAMAVLLAGCAGHETLIRNHRLAVMPRNGGYIAKHVEEAGSSERMRLVAFYRDGDMVVEKDFCDFNLGKGNDVAFRSSVSGDTAFLYYAEPDFKPRPDIVSLRDGFVVKFVLLSPADWLTSGFLENDPMLYSNGLN